MSGPLSGSKSRIRRPHQFLCSVASLAATSFLLTLLADKTAAFTFIFQGLHNRYQSDIYSTHVKGRLSRVHGGASRANFIASLSQITPSITSSTTSLYAAKSSESDAQEWKGIVEALKMYKISYSDLKVPSRFVVPSMPPWPESAWGMRLGSKVGAIRSTGKYIRENDARRQTLESLGFVWRVRSPSKEKSTDVRDSSVTFDQIYSALVVYREEVQPEGILRIPQDFIVPNSDPWPASARGLPLGSNMPKLYNDEFLRGDTSAKEKLKQLGLGATLKPSATDVRFQLVYKALARYKELNGDLNIPQPFTVPEESEDWPEDTWGMRLGARVNSIRSQGTFVNTDPERREILDRLGFVWILPSEVRNRRGESDDGRIKGNSSPAELDGLSPLDLFGEDSEENDPISSDWGFEDGGKIDVASKMEEIYTPQVENIFERPTLRESLGKARQRAIDCGVLDPISDARNTKKAKQEKDIPWFNDDFGEGFVFEDVVEALTLYKSFYGDFSNLTDANFVIPSRGDEEEDPFDVEQRELQELAKLPLRRSPDIPSLIEDEFEAMPAIELSTTTAPLLEGAEWPEYLGGMLLGNIVSRIRDGCLEVKHLPERKKILDDIGFDWGDPKRFIDIPFEKAMCAMFSYYLIRGDTFADEDFKIPNEEPWPEALAGYEVGKTVKRVRELQNFFEAFHREKLYLLRMVDFVWFPSVALPIDPNEPEMTPEMLTLCAMGHPDLAKMQDIPMGWPEKIMEDGPFFETDDPKQWWRKWHSWDHVEDYWYQHGRRDNAHVLRSMGYHQMADEHEAKYGPGLLQQIHETMQDLETGIEDRPEEELQEIVETLEYFREEMINCTDIPFQDVVELIENIDMQLDAIVGEDDEDEDAQGEEDIQADDIEEIEEEEYEYYYEEEEEEYEEDSEEDFDFDEEYDEEELETDLTDELGLGDETIEANGKV